MKLTIALGIVVFFLALGGFFVVRNASVEVADIPLLSFVPTPTPAPFAELTIPFLRTRIYESTLGARTRFSETDTYTSYITSYMSDGLKINGLLTIPKGPPPAGGGLPAIVFIHGYIPPADYRTTTRYASHVDYLARSGFVVFKIDLRGHGQSEGDPGGAYYSSDYVIDVLNARAALGTISEVDADRIGLWGHSMAGNVAMRAFAARPEIPAVVIWAGAGYTYTDLSTYRISDTSYRLPADNTQRQKKREQLRSVYGDFDPKSPFWKQVAITDYLKDISGALEIHHAVDDTVVSIEYSRNLMKLLDATNVSHQLFEYPSGGHNIEGSSFTSAMQRTVSFFTAHL